MDLAVNVIKVCVAFLIENTTYTKDNIIVFHNENILSLSDYSQFSRELTHAANS